MNECCRHGDEGSEALVRFARTHCDTSVFLELAEVVLDQVPPFVRFFVEGRWKTPVGFWRDNGGNAVFGQCCAQPVSVECAVSQHVASYKAIDEVGHGTQIMRLSGHQTEINEVPECVRQGQNFGCDPAT